ncbi:type VII secretion protein EccE [Micromonospora echinaurantiaca]|uniref:type VII secretion protein EccE n=1 Tax=Micromonospora echinaurantiaca TaxID=47857 RepID=UPI0037B1EC18
MARISTALSLLSVAVVGTVAVVVLTSWWIGAFLALALLALGLSCRPRRDGRSWWTSRRIRRRFHRRARSQSPLGAVVAGLVVDEVTGVPGPPVAVARDPAGWFAVGEVQSATPMVDGPAEPVGLAAALAAATVYDIPGLTVQAVIHTVIPQGEPVATHSYYELMAQLTGGVLPAARTTWVVARVDARAWAAADRAQVAVPATAGALRRIVRAMARDGIEVRPLPRKDLIEAVSRSLETVPGLSDSERWGEWMTRDLAHRTFHLRQWPAPELVSALAALPASMTSVAVALVPNGPGTRARCLVRIAQSAEELPAAEAAAHAIATRAGTVLVPLDGEQAAGAYATAPTGGGPW